MALNFVETFDEGFRMSRPKIALRSAVQCRCGVYTSGGIDLIAPKPSVPDHIPFGRIRFGLDSNLKGYFRHSHI